MATSLRPENVVIFGESLSGNTIKGNRTESL